MSLIKPLLAVILGASGWIFGSMLAEKERKGFYQTVGIVELLKAMKTHITYSRTEIYGVFESFHNKYLDECGFTKCFENCNIMPVNQVWHESVEKLDVCEKVKNELLMFGSNLGSLDCLSQLNYLDSCIEFLQAHLRDTEEKSGRKVKNMRTLGLLCGLAIGIILY